MKQRLQGLVVGIIIGISVAGTIAYSATQNLEALFNNIKIIVDGKEIKPQDASGNNVEPFIVSGTTYLPVRAVANALGKEVYWDGSNYTVYLGNMGGGLKYPTLKMEDATDISGNSLSKASTTQLTDNYGNKYGTSYYSYFSDRYFQSLLNMKYSSFKGTAYIKQGESDSDVSSFTIEADGKTVYSSPEMNKTSSPIQLDIDIIGCNDFKIKAQGELDIFFGDCGFYQ